MSTDTLLASDVRLSVTPTIPARFLSELIGGGRVKRAETAAAIGVELESLKDATRRFSPQQFATAARMVAQWTGDELFGLYKNPVPVGSRAYLLRTYARCSTAREAIEEGGRFFALFDGGQVPWQVAAGLRRSSIVLTRRTPKQATSLLYAHMMLLGIWHAVSWLCGEEVPLEEVTLPTRFRAFRRESAYLFGCTPRYGDTASLTIANRLLDAPVMRRQSDADVFIDRSLDSMMGPGPQLSLVASVRALLKGHRPYANMNQSSAAHVLGMTRHELTARLRLANTSFQSIRDEMRLERACFLLSQGQLSIAQIAEDLGYSEASAFHRTFRRWKGDAPSRYRRRHRQRSTLDFAFQD